ncbi:MAG: hypothetical protein RJA63_378 [Pseudomonadota bacterium]|jgi:hypothetical protein
MKAGHLPPDAAQMLRDKDRAGIYVADDDTARAMFQAGPAAGFNVYRIDLSQAHSAQELHRIFGKALHFPEWHGNNWDALADSLTDMSWNEADGYLLILQRSEVLAKNSPDDHETLLQVLADTVAAWREQGLAFWILFVGDFPSLPSVRVTH